MGQQAVLLIRSTECGWNNLLAVLASMPDACIVGQATNGPQAVTLATAHHPAVIIAPAKLNDVATLPLVSHLRERIVPAETHG